MHKLTRTLATALLASSLAGCHFLYVPDVQQGNWLEKKDVDQLKPGLTKRQVLVLLGTPSVATPFEQDRWDYVSTNSLRGRKPTIHSLTLTFNNDILVRTQGDFFAQDASKALKRSERYRTKYSVNDEDGDKKMGPKPVDPNAMGNFGGAGNKNGSGANGQH
ncbi:outer membrane protein assembly factor BamE [Frateuria aurantia]|uniref:Outer membrane protein assembly factor BamE n=1 Tax=Frateuria aurantia (strain ATCC 33424 / DSM 6220 / KCTC 2777 / LMG 1558 / NBRC 3245 / NCIMB 13370) TaxID=767434 RepID=H8L5G5_FRAAD|nr:outer membrane protein assembly factor BamE [Frateuria aurantia]AFC85766.1 small protein A (tmRNA-binding) [Frateuria aurantia DSM 6220]